MAEAPLHFGGTDFGALSPGYVGHRPTDFSSSRSVGNARPSPASRE
jgi:hypothetical protein